MCRSFAQKSTRWDEAAATKFEERRQKLQRDLLDLPDYHRLQEEQGAVRREINDARFKFNSLEETVRTARLKLQKRSQALTDVKEAISKKQPQLKACKIELANSRKKVLVSLALLLYTG